jgi:heptosyltransferase I
MRVLIIKTSALGDIIHALAIPDYLHRVCPGIEVDWVVEEPFKDILAGNPLLHRLHVIRTRRWRKSIFSADTLREICDTWKGLKYAEYNMVFDIQGNLKSGIIAWLSRAKVRFGFTRDFLQEPVNALFTTHKIAQRKQDDDASARCLRVVSAAFGMDYSGMDLAVDIYTTLNENAVAEKLIQDCNSEQVFLFHGGTTWQTKFWSEERWIELGKAVHENFPDSMILFSWGNDSEKSSAERVALGIGYRVRVLDKYSLKGIAAIIKKVDAVIGADTGLIHLAAAVGTPTVSYYRASDGSVSGPRGSNHVIVQSPFPCTRCFRTSCHKDSECRNSITVDAILAGIKKLQSHFKLRTDQPPASAKVHA